MYKVYIGKLNTEKPNESISQLKTRFFNKDYTITETIDTESREEYAHIAGKFAMTEIKKHSKKSYILFTDDDYFIMSNQWFIHHFFNERG